MSYLLERGQPPPHMSLPPPIHRFAHAGGEHSLYLSPAGSLHSAGACGLDWSRAQDLVPSLFSWRPVPLGAPIASVASGYYHNLAISSSGSLFSWGCGAFLDSKNDGSIPALGQGVGAEDVGGLPKQVEPFPHTAVAAAAGAYHSVVLTRANKVLTFGAAQLGQLGRAPSSDATDSSSLPVDPTPSEVEGIPVSQPELTPTTTLRAPTTPTALATPTTPTNFPFCFGRSLLRSFRSRRFFAHFASLCFALLRFPSLASLTSLARRGARRPCLSARASTTLTL
jgi:hypothetical protein